MYIYIYKYIYLYISIYICARIFIYRSKTVATGTSPGSYEPLSRPSPWLMVDKFQGLSYGTLVWALTVASLKGSELWGPMLKVV